MSLFKKMAKISGNEYAFMMHEENFYETKEWIDTGCIPLNAVLCDGDIFKGMPAGKRILLAGKSGVAKSYFTAFLIKKYLDTFPNSYAVFLESEGSSVLEMIRAVGIPEDRVIIMPVMTVEEARNQLSSMLDGLIEHNKKAKKEEDKERYIFCLDSLGMLSTDNEVKQVKKGSQKDNDNKKDMSKSSIVRSLGRLTSMKFSMANANFLCVNHTHIDIATYGAPEKVSGGEGAIYMGDVILLLQKTKDVVKKGDKNIQIGAKIAIKVVKSRFMKENKTIDVYMSFKKGILPYGGVVSLAEKYGVLKTRNAGSKGKQAIIDGAEVPMSEVLTNPEKYIIGDVLKELRDAIHTDFAFGDGGDTTDDWYRADEGEETESDSE